jgi:hypothetical protein
MKKIVITAIISIISLLVLTSFIKTPVVVSYQPTELASTGTIQNVDLEIKRMIFDDSEHWTISEIAEIAEIYMSHYEIAFRVPKIHAINPEITCLIYRNIRAVHESNPEEYELFSENGWLLRDANGTLIQSKTYGYTIVDVGNSRYQEWVANWIKKHIDDYGYDGVFIDNCLPSTEILWSTSPASAINPRTGQPYTNSEFKDAIISLVNKIRSMIGDGKIIGNGIFNGKRFFDETYHQGYIDLLNQSEIDGVVSEGWLMSLENSKWSSESEWLDGLNFIGWLQNNFLTNNKMFLPVCYNAAPYDQEDPALPTQCTKEQYVLYGFCSLLLAVDVDGEHFMNYGYYDSEYVDSLFGLKLGMPLGSYYMITETHVYARDYTRTKVFVNPTYNTYTIKLQQPYQTFNGEPVEKSITIKPHTAEILIKR